MNSGIDIHLKTHYFSRRFFGELYNGTGKGIQEIFAKKVVPAVTSLHPKINGAKEQAPKSTSSNKNIASSEEDKLILRDAVMGKVITRFPPEASGYIHIGHAKAALVNRMLADKYQGKLLFRFDDTNPNKENPVFEDICMEDLATLGVSWDMGPTYSSDYMDVYVLKCNELIDSGLAYCDTTPREEIQKCRFDGIATKCRENSSEENHRLWKEMQAATDEGRTACVRAKISLTDANKAMRDPVIFRVNIQHHARQGRKYNVYPTYDFCCPIIDSIEGVTHALRTNEYHDRNAQYDWFIDTLGLRKPLLEDFSRLNMEYSLMSKRKLNELVLSGVVDGWDDPRFPTVRALVRRGLKVSALRDFVKVQGMSKAVNWMEWSKLWNFNVQILDPSVSRYTAVSDDLKTECTVINGVEYHNKPFIRPRHKKNAELGEKTCYYNDMIYLDAEDVALLKDGDEITLMDWGNAYVKDIVKDEKSGLPIKANIELHLEGNVRSTKHKLTWVPKSDEHTVKFICNEYDHILTKKKPEPEENIDEIINRDSKHTQYCIGELPMKELKKGDYLQLERRGYYIIDDMTPQLTLIHIPDGRDKVNHLSAKYQYLKTHPVAPPASVKSKIQQKKSVKKSVSHTSSTSH